jgi:hypothetical protein
VRRKNILSLVRILVVVVVQPFLGNVLEENVER